MLLLPEPAIYASALCAGCALWLLIKARFSLYNDRTPDPLKETSMFARMRASNKLAEEEKGPLALIARTMYDLLWPFFCMASLYSFLNLYLSIGFSVGADTTLRAVESLTLRLQSPPWSFFLKPGKWYVLLGYLALVLIGSLMRSFPVKGIWRLWKKWSKFTKFVTLAAAFVAWITFFGPVQGKLIRIRIAVLAQRGHEIRVSFTKTREAVEKGLTKEMVSQFLSRVQPHVERVEAESYRDPLVEIVDVREIIKQTLNTRGEAVGSDSAQPKPEPSRKDIPDTWSRNRAESIIHEATRTPAAELSENQKSIVDAFADAAYGGFSKDAAKHLQNSSDAHEVIIGYMIEPLIDALASDWIKRQARSLATKVLSGELGWSIAAAKARDSVDSQLATHFTKSMENLDSEIEAKLRGAQREKQQEQDRLAKRQLRDIAGPGWTITESVMDGGKRRFLHDRDGVLRAVLEPTEDDLLWTVAERPGEKIRLPSDLKPTWCLCEP